MDHLNLHEQNFSFLGQESKVVGLFQFKGPTKISSNLEGEIDMLSEDLLTIEVLGKIKGNIRCHDLEIFGNFEGVIYAKGTIIIHHTASIYGEINATNLIVKPGSQLNADIHTNEAAQLA